LLSVYELQDLYDEICERIGSDGLLELLTYANRIDGLQGLLESLGMENLLNKNNTPFFVKKKVLVLGDSRIKIDKLKSIIRKDGFMEPSDFEFCLDYGDVKRFNYRRLRHSETFGVVIVGPQPHSTPGKLDSSSAIVEMEHHPEKYPKIIRCMNARGELEIGNNSFKNALEELKELAA
jgi:hypothetical protein